MDKNLLKKIKGKLEKEKERLEKTLASFAEKDKKLKGDWDTRMPKMDSGRLEEETDEVEEFSNLLPIKNTLELELEKINLALKKIKQEKYGICEKCKEPIPQIRLKIYPQAKYCKKCEVK